MAVVRISGVIFPPNKHLQIALQSIYGVGHHRALFICNKLGLDPAIKTAALRDDQVTLLQEAVNEFEVEGDLRRRVAMNIKRLSDIKCYRGLRHKRGLPVRGQRTRTNARTRKGKKKQQQVSSKSGAK
jgi:small subunit ribosomal protein S13